jgi:hypothetical protein
MSTSIVLWAGAVGVPGVDTVLVMALALGLCSAVAVALCQLALRPHLVAAVDNDAVRADRRPWAMASLSSLWPGWRRPRQPRPGDARVGGESPAGAPVAAEEVAVIGYTTFLADDAREPDEDLAKQAGIIARACERRGLTLVEMVSDPHQGRRLFQPRLLAPPAGLDYALKRIAAGEAQGLLVPGLRRLARSAAELGPIVEWFLRRRAQLVAVAQGFDTSEPAGYVAARVIIEVSRWERERLWEPTHEGQSPSPGTAASVPSDDEPEHIYPSEGGTS